MKADRKVLLESRSLVKNFGSFPAVNGLDLEVGAGEMVGLVGPDGAGKTTSIRMMCGALTPSSGTVTVAGFEIPRQVEKAREHIGYLAQRFSLYGDLTVSENLDFFGKVFSMDETERKTRAKELLEFAGLSQFSDRKAAALSGGMQKKVGLAAALIHRPKVLLLDEPTGGVDPIARQEFWQMLIRLLREGSAVLISTPYMDEALRFDRVIFMNKGRALVKGTPRELLHRLDGKVLELATNDQMVSRKLAEQDPDVQDVHAFGDRLHLRVSSPEGPMKRLPKKLAAKGIKLHHLKLITPSLEDVFMQLVELDQNGNFSNSSN
jgi:drug efflux transport system ATP-binding protein